MHAAVCQSLGVEVSEGGASPASPFTLAGYRSDPPPTAYLQDGAVGQPLPDVPLFLDGGVFVWLPTEATYAQATVDLDPADLPPLAND